MASLYKEKKSTIDLSKLKVSDLSKTNGSRILTDQAKNSITKAASSIATSAAGNASKKITASNDINQFDSSAYDADFAKANEANEAYKAHTSGSMISDRTQEALDKKFKTPTEVKKADAWLKEQLEVIQSGKTSYSDQVRDMINQIKNREEFSYDVDKDPLFQQALASSLNSGQMAMQNTMAQASALTGGYGSSYATSAANQAYNVYIQDAYDNLPQYYQMARDAYDAQGEQMYKMYSMLSSEDDKEYNRNISAYDATYQRRNRVYDEAYAQYRDEMSDAYAMAGIEMQKYSQKSNDLYNAYTIASDIANSKYEREYNKWRDEATLALEMYNQQQEQERFTTEFNQRKFEFETTNALDREMFESDKAFKEQELALESSKFESDKAFQQQSIELEKQKMEDENNWRQKELDFGYAQLAQKASSGSGSGSGSGSKSGGGSQKPYKLTNTDINGMNERYASAGGGQAGFEAVLSYLAAIGKPATTQEQLAIVESQIKPAGVDVISNPNNLIGAVLSGVGSVTKKK